MVLEARDEDAADLRRKEGLSLTRCEVGAAFVHLSIPASFNALAKARSASTLPFPNTL